MDTSQCKVAIVVLYEKVCHKKIACELSLVLRYIWYVWWAFFLHFDFLQKTKKIGVFCEQKTKKAKKFQHFFPTNNDTNLDF